MNNPHSSERPAAIIHLVGALLPKQKVELQLDGRRIFLKQSIAKLNKSSVQLQDQPTTALRAAA